MSKVHRISLKLQFFKTLFPEHLQSKKHKKRMWRKKEREGTQFTSQENVTVKSLAAANDVWRDTQEYKS